MNTADTTSIVHLTLSELRELIRVEVQAALDQREAQPSLENDALSLPTIDVGEWPAALSLRREDMYGDNER